jgi:flagellar biosynthesis protein FlhG
LEFAPNSKAAQALRQIAQQVDQWPLPSSPTGRLEFFVERLLQAANSRY